MSLQRTVSWQQPLICINMSKDSSSAFVTWYQQILKRRSLSPAFTFSSLKSFHWKKKGEGEEWGERKVTATAGLSWDAGQDVDSFFHFPSAFILSTVPFLYSLLLLLCALMYISTSSPASALLFFFYLSPYLFRMQTKRTPVPPNRRHLLYCTVQEIKMWKLVIG